MKVRSILAVAAVCFLAACAGQEPAPVLTTASVVDVDQAGSVAPVVDRSADLRALQSANALIVQGLWRTDGTLIDAADGLLTREALAEARFAATGAVVRWSNPATASSGEVAVLDVADAEQRQCRRYRISLTIGGRTLSALASACTGEAGASVSAQLCAECGGPQVAARR